MRVLLASPLHANTRSDRCFPGQDRLATEFGCTRVRVMQFVKELQALGLIKVTRRGQGKTKYLRASLSCEVEEAGLTLTVRAQIILGQCSLRNLRNGGMVAMNNDWTKIYRKHAAEWIALADDEVTVIASGASAREALERSLQ